MIPSSLLPDDTVLYSCVACLLRFMPHLPITLSYTDTKSASTRFLSHSSLWIEPHIHGVDGAQVGHILQKHIITYPHRSSHVCKAFLVDIVTYICFCKFPQSRWPQLVSNARMWLTSESCAERISVCLTVKDWRWHSNTSHIHDEQHNTTWKTIKRKSCQCYTKKQQPIV